MAVTPEERIAVVWPHLKPEEVLIVGPLGSRYDTLLFNRRDQRVSTGMRGAQKACFEGTLDEFEQAVEESYAVKVNESYTEGPKRKYQTYWDEYRAVIVLLRSLPGPTARTVSGEYAFG